MINISTFDLLSSFSNYALYQVSNVPNSQGKFLDLIFSNNYSDIFISRCLSPLSNVDTLYNEPIDIHLNFGYKMSNIYNEIKTVFNFKQTDFNGLNNYLKILIGISRS